MSRRRRRDRGSARQNPSPNVGGRPAVAPGASGSNGWPWALAALLVTAVLVVYWQVRNFELIDFDDPTHNDFVVVNQYSVKGDRTTRRPDVVVFVNGMESGCALAVAGIRSASPSAAASRNLMR